MFRWGTMLLLVLFLVIAGGAVVLTLLDPRPPLKHFEVPVRQ